MRPESRLPDLPILFSAPMARALLDGLKTQTRRVVEGPDAGPKWRVGMRLWVREGWRTSVGADRTKPRDLEGHGWPLWYDADGGVPTWTWARSGGPAFTTPGRHRASIHLPRWASRASLLVTDVRVERLRSISEEDALAEGISDGDSDGPKKSYERLWGRLHGADAWERDPWVAVLSFEASAVAVGILPVAAAA